MARLPRLSIAGQLHQVMQRGTNGEAIFRDDEDCRAFLQALQDAAATHRVALHAYALLPDELHLLVTPATGEGLSKLMQSIGRRHVAAFNARHGRRGTLWEGRFRATVVEAEPYLRLCQTCIETMPVRAGLVNTPETYPWSSAAHHVGVRADRLVTAHALDWASGNTPFEREMAHKMLLRDGVPAAECDRIQQAVATGWALGSADFVAALEKTLQRRAQPGQAGRPRKVPTGP